MNEFLPTGRFAIGANYWASHAGLAMWRDWRPEAVEEDFRFLRREGLRFLRVFPLWPDFQPITLLRGGNGAPIEVRHGESPLPDDGCTKCGLSEEMLERFIVMADLAECHGLDLVVGLVTGWMSGRLFVPPALEGVNVITSPLALMWQVRFVQGFVGRLQSHPAIKAWDLGNECNAMGQATREESWVWTHALTSAIRAADPTRPVISGMHSLSVDPAEPWAIRDQGELTDFLTTHPYPLFTPHCHREPLDTMRPILHGTAETCLYSDLGGKPAFVEEFGNLGPMVCGASESAGFARAALASLWAHDGRAAFWWCAFDQLSLDYAPYDWTALERELGLATENRRPKAVMREFQAFSEGLPGLPFADLPKRRIDAVCVLTPGQDQWGVAYSTFILAKQAGFDIRFHYADGPLPEKGFYLFPSLNSFCSLSRRREDELWARVGEGASVYISLEKGLLGRFREGTGLEVATRAERKAPCEIILPGGSVKISGGMQYKFRSCGAEILARDCQGTPVFFCHRFGKGKVFLLGVPLEASLAGENQVFVDEERPLHHHLYRQFAEDLLAARVVRKNNPWIGVTEHELEDGRVIIVLINYSTEPQEDIVAIAEPYRRVEADLPPESRRGRLQGVSLPANGHAILELRPEAACEQT